MSLMDQVNPDLAECHTLGVSQPLAHLGERTVPDVRQTSGPRMQADGVVDGRIQHSQIHLRPLALIAEIRDDRA